MFWSLVAMTPFNSHFPHEFIRLRPGHRLHLRKDGKFKRVPSALQLRPTLPGQRAPSTELEFEGKQFVVINFDES